MLHPSPRSNVQAAKTWIREREARACDTEKNTPNYIENIIILCRFIKLFCRYISHMLSRTRENAAPSKWLGKGGEAAERSASKYQAHHLNFLRHFNNNSHSNLARPPTPTHTVSLSMEVVNINEKHIIKYTLAWFDDLSWLFTKKVLTEILSATNYLRIMIFVCVIESDYNFHPYCSSHFMWDVQFPNNQRYNLL